jgi:hypothetical protein
MIVIRSSVPGARPCRAQQDCGNGPWHIADVLDELFERIALRPPESEPSEIEAQVAV